MTLTHPRLPDWQDRLSALIARAHREPFVWGQRDCCLWAADAALALTGIDHAADLRETYTDKASALAVLSRIGGLRGAADRAGRRIRPAFAIEGDVAIVRSGGHPCLAVRAANVWLCSTARGLFAASPESAVIAWRIGNA